jgi:hypothetical protein
VPISSRRRQCLDNDENFDFVGEIGRVRRVGLIVLLKTLTTAYELGAMKMIPIRHASHDRLRRWRFRDRVALAVRIHRSSRAQKHTQQRNR